MCCTEFAAILFNFFFKGRSREINGGEANDDAAANDETTRGASSAHTSAEGQGLAPSSGYDYEVFLSFRGPDTRVAFTDFLYTSLDSAGIRTFKDDEELRVGKEFAPDLLQAIKQSKISIPIFSKSYASSVWCLKEVAQMVECQKTGRQKIMPIFYDVAPSEVRHQTGGFREAFRSHEDKKRYDPKTMQEWKDALSAVGDINGWDLHKEGENRREGDFAKKIAEKVFKELKRAYLVVSDNLVSVDNHVDAIMDMIGAQTSETRIIGIHGMGGIGKTTIAKLIYNRLSHDFTYCCFLGDIREMSKGKGIQFLQKQLIRDILKIEHTDIRNSGDGINIIKESLPNKRVLLLLDDVDHMEHMRALVGNHGWFGKGSKLIITTRNKEVLNVPEVDDLYEVSIMDPDQSLQLFSKHAFRSDCPLDNYINHSERAVEIAGGLPLVLEIIGSLLAHIEKEKWDVKLKKLEDVPREEVRNKLRISYDTLDDLEKHIFLDITCLFIGYDKDTMVYFWESEFHPEDALDVLENRSLIKINEDNKVWVHDQLRDLGREIVRQGSDKIIEKQSRVWDPKEVSDLLRTPKGDKEVQALRLKLDHEQQHRFTYEGFESLSKLRFLEVDGPKGSFRAENKLFGHESSSNGLEKSVLVPQLRWLSWRDIPPKFNIANFSMENVVILNLSGSTITHHWKGWSHVQGMKRLKVLDLSKCYMLESLPNELGRGLASLEYLSLTWCRKLKRLPDSIGKLTSLIALDISQTSIEELPRSIGKLRNLKVVKMESTNISKIPDAFWEIGNLKEVEASGGEERLRGNIGRGIYENKSLSILKFRWADIYELPPLPESLTILQLGELCMETFPDISNLTGLKELDLTFARSGDGGKCNGLGEDWIPRWIVDLTKLEYLRLREYLRQRSHDVATASTDLSLPPHLKSLRPDYPNLGRLPRLPSSLSSLQYQCESLRSMEDLSNLKNLSSLYLQDCHSLRSMDLSGLKKLSSLKILRSGIAEIQGLGCLENLRELRLDDLQRLKVLPDLRNSNKLRCLYVAHCGNLVEIGGELPLSLDSLNIYDCPSLVKLPDLSNFVGKGVIWIKTCEKLNVDAIFTIGRSYLGVLHIERVQQLRFLPDLRDLTNSSEITSLQVASCDDLAEIRGKLPESLEKLKIYECKSLREVSDLSSSTRLRKVSICRCDDLAEIRGKLPESLEKLNIFMCKSLLELPDLSSLTRLRKVSICQCDDLAEIRGKLPESLEKLDISSCRSLRKLPNMSSLIGLEEVSIHGYGNLIEIGGELPQSLKILKIHSCGSFQKLPNMLGLIKPQEVSTNNCDDLIEILDKLPQSLEILKISSCDSLVEIQGELPESLKILDISFSKSLQKLPDLSSSMGLREVRIKGCRSLVEIQGELPESLEILNIYHCVSLQKLPDLSSSMGLRKVLIYLCNDLVQIQGNVPESLEILNISCCKSLQEFPNMSSSMGLRELSINCCDDMVQIQGEVPVSLEKLYIRSCKSLRRLPSMSRSMELQEVYICDCGDLIEIQGGLPQSLENLWIESCGSLQKFPDLSSLTGLREFSVGECGDLVEIQGKLPQSLEKLRILSCGSLQKFPDLSSLTGLREFSLFECADLVEIQGELPQSLEKLKIFSGKSLQKFPDLSSLKGLRKVEMYGCKKLNMEAISLLCSKNSVEFVGKDKWDKEDD